LNSSNNTTQNSSQFQNLLSDFDIFVLSFHILDFISWDFTDPEKEQMYFANYFEDAFLGAIRKLVESLNPQDQYYEFASQLLKKYTNQELANKITEAEISKDIEELNEKFEIFADYYDKVLVAKRIQILHEVLDYYSDSLSKNTDTSYSIEDINLLRSRLKSSAENESQEDFFFVLKEMRIKFAKTKDIQIIESDTNQIGQKNQLI